MNSVAIIICTYNRSASLRLTFESLCQMQPPAVAHWEVLVIDNNSTDDTPALCREFQDRLPIRCVFEKAQGLSNARNRGLQETSADLVVFTDDDVDLDPAWLSALVDAARAHPEIGFLGGRIFPRNEVTPPAWMVTHSKMIGGVTMHLDLGDEPKFFASPFGANMAFTRAALATQARFRTDLGRIGKSMFVHEETVFIEKLRAAGWKGYYVPTAIVHHRNAPGRLNVKYFRKWYVGDGMTQVRLGEISGNGPRLFSAPRYLWRQLLQRWLHTRWRQIFGPEEKWIRSEMDLAHTYGHILEFRNQLSGGNKP